MKGFTLLETVVALTLFLIMIAGFSQAVASQVTHGRNSDIRAKAAMAAQFFLDDLRSEDPATLPTSGAGTTETVTIDDKEFEVTPEYCTEIAYCTSANIRHILVSVVHNGNDIYSVETVYTRLR